MHRALLDKLAPFPASPSLVAAWLIQKELARFRSQVDLIRKPPRPQHRPFFTVLKAYRLAAPTTFTSEHAPRLVFDADHSGNSTLSTGNQTTYKEVYAFAARHHASRKAIAGAALFNPAFRDSNEPERQSASTPDADIDAFPLVANSSDGEDDATVQRSASKRRRITKPDYDGADVPRTESAPPTLAYTRMYQA